jgi:hypothetical protein
MSGSEDTFADDQQPIEAVFEFESGTRCGVCGLYHADQWHCDPNIPNPWVGEG